MAGGYRMGANLNHFDSLTENQREVLSRWAIDGLSMRKLAKEQGKSVVAIFKTIQRAKARLLANGSDTSCFRTASAA